MSKCPVHFAFDAPDFLVITGPRFSTAARGDHGSRIELSSEEKEALRDAAIARNEARREARALVVEENARRREAQKLIEAAAKEAISRRLQEEKRASMLTPEQKLEQKRARVAVAQAAYRAKTEERKARKAALKALSLAERMKGIQEGWITLTATSKLYGMAMSTCSKYARAGFVKSVSVEGKVYIDPDAMRDAYLARQASNLQMLRDNIHKARLAKHTFCGTVTD